MRSVYKVHACVVCTFGVLRKEDDHAITSYNEEKTNKFKDPEFMSSFIDKYTEMRNLWEVKHSLYYNKQVRKTTLEKLLGFVKTQIPEANMKFLETKIGILRNMYRKEHNKIQASLRSGGSADYVYVSKLWYFQKLRFLDDQTEARESLSTFPCRIPSTLPSTLPSTPAEADKEQPGPSILEEADAPSWSQVYYFLTYLLS
ncbi:hypothetical protein AB205_0157780 [Aquarana catesbeiana]|uniref:MADF domain-containing protein n=1 Tax=Aquarana catesbeiana TaxID=8400 RepID=A0A2G9P509_AQUCT|nr:hypothetical protein AB205_0157780 [Aquarana catesbeiana]